PARIQAANHGGCARAEDLDSGTGPYARSDSHWRGTERRALGCDCVCCDRRGWPSSGHPDHAGGPTRSPRGRGEMIEGIRQIQELMEQQAYVTDRTIATTIFLAMELHKPVLIEGPAGVGKTEVAKVLASALATRL